MLRRFALTLVLLWTASAFAADAVSITNLTRYSNNPIMPVGFVSWGVNNLADFCVIVNPADPTKLIMYFSAFFTIDQADVGRIDGLASDPQGGWNLAGARQAVLARGASGAWDDRYIRLNSCFYLPASALAPGVPSVGTFYIYYSGSSQAAQIDQMGLATSSDGITFTKNGTNPILTPTGQGRNDGTQVDNGDVVIEGGVWYMVYSYRSATVTLPGKRYATSPDGVTWTKQGAGDIWTCPVGQYCESHRLVKYGNIWLMIFDYGNTSTSWTEQMLEGATPIGPFVLYSGNPILTKNGSGSVPCCTGALPWPGWEQFHVATAQLFLWPSSNPFSSSNPQGYLYYQGAGDLNQPYTSNTWSGGVAAVTLSAPPVVVAGGKGRWRML